MFLGKFFIYLSWIMIVIICIHPISFLVFDDHKTPWHGRFQTLQLTYAISSKPDLT